jgi:hypothetical protein
MINCSPLVHNAIPEEYRKITEKLFPSRGYAPGTGPNLSAVTAFAKILGIRNEYNKFLEAQTELSSFLGHFQNNLDLLIQKTWVEKADETRKEKLQNRVPGFIADIERGDYQKALSEFSGILEELAYLFFGAQSQKEDFTEYTMRVDTQIGLFWWYGAQIGRLRSHDDNTLKAVLLIGICYLTNF